MFVRIKWFRIEELRLLYVCVRACLFVCVMENHSFDCFGVELKCKYKPNDKQTMTNVLFLFSFCPPPSVHIRWSAVLVRITFLPSSQEYNSYRHEHSYLRHRGWVRVIIAAKGSARMPRWLMRWCQRCPSSGHPRTRQPPGADRDRP